MELIRTPDSQVKLSQARHLMREALAILDQLGGIGDVGAHLDLALCRLENHLGVKRAGIEGLRQLRAELDKQSSEPSSQPAESPWELNRFDAV